MSSLLNKNKENQLKIKEKREKKEKWERRNTYKDFFFVDKIFESYKNRVRGGLSRNYTTFVAIMILF